MEAGGGRWAGPAKKGTQEKQEGGEKTGGLGWGHGPRAQGVAREDTQQTGASRCRVAESCVLPHKLSCAMKSLMLQCILKESIKELQANSTDLLS